MDNRGMLEKERAELNRLINKGVAFEVEDTEFTVERRLCGLVRKHVPVRVKRKFKIEEPTLGTLDRLSAEWIEFAIDEAALKSDDGMQKARTLAHEHSMRCAKVVAIAALGSDLLIPKIGSGGVVRYVEDAKQLDELTSLFARSIKPSKLYQLYVLINAMCNLGDFLNSIRLMSADRTTMPIRIEENSGD